MSQKVINAKVTDVSGDTFTAYASVEVVDLEGDIIRIDGIDLKYNTPDNPIKIFPDHTYFSEANPQPLTIGRVEAIEKALWKDTDIPALKFVGSWAKKPDGQFTDLAKAHKELYETGYMDSFSVGLNQVEGEKTNSGVDWTKTELIEISCASIPANRLATVIKTLKKHNVRTKDMDTPQTLNPTAVAGQGYTYEVNKKDMGDMMTESIGKCMDHVTKCFKDHCDTMGKCFKDLNDRMDDMESSFSVAQDGPAPTTSRKALKELEVKKQAEAATKAVSDLMNELAGLRKIAQAQKE